MKIYEDYAPSPELAARIRQWIDELTAKGLQNWLLRTCKELDILPLHATSIYLWALRPDGVVLCMDHEAFRQTTEPETDPLTIYAALAQGARTHPELRELLPGCPTGTRECDLCQGLGWTKAPGEETGTGCLQCNGLGWYATASPR